MRWLKLIPLIYPWSEQKSILKEYYFVIIWFFLLRWYVSKQENHAEMDLWKSTSIGPTTVRGNGSITVLQEQDGPGMLFKIVPLIVQNRPQNGSVICYFKNDSHLTWSIFLFDKLILMGYCSNFIFINCQFSSSAMF